MLINCYHGFSCLGLEKILSLFLEHSEEYVSVSAGFKILCCRNWHRFMSRLRGVYLLSVFRRKLKLLTYLHTISYHHIRFLNTRSQLVWVLASDEGTLSVRVCGKPWKQLFDVHENSGLNRQKKNPSRAFVSGNHCKVLNWR